MSYGRRSVTDTELAATDTELLADVARTLRSQQVNVPQGARSRARAALSAAETDEWRGVMVPRRPVWVAAAVAVVVAGVWGAWLLSRPGAPPDNGGDLNVASKVAATSPSRTSTPAPPVDAMAAPRTVELETAASVSLEGGHVTLTAKRPSVLEVPGKKSRSATVKLATVKLASGALRARVRAGRVARFNMATPHARMEGTSAVFHVAVQVAGTAIAVSEGTVTVISIRLPMKQRSLGAGERVFVPSSGWAAKLDRARKGDADRTRVRRLPRRQRAAPRQRKNTSSRRNALVQPPAALREDLGKKMDAWRPVAVAHPRAVHTVAPEATPRVRSDRAAARAAANRAQTPRGNPPAAKKPPVVITLLHQADQLRRAGRFRAAADRYRQAAFHPAAGPYAEEALLRLAMLQSERLGDHLGALRTLALAGRRLPATSALRPERCAFVARIHLKRGALALAAATLSRCPPRGRHLMRLRLQVARALWRDESQRGQARRLLAPLLGDRVPSALKRAAKGLIGRGDQRPQKK